MPVDNREVQNSWDEFVKEYNFILKFGVQALQEKLNRLAASEGQTFRLNATHVDEVMTELGPRLDKALEHSIQLALRQQQQPRADYRPDEMNKNLGIEEGLVERRRQQFEQAPWGDKFDIASNTSIQDSFDDYKALINAENQAEPGQANKNKLTLKFDAQRQELVEKLRMEAKQRLTMDYAPKMRPKRPGEA